MIFKLLLQTYAKKMQSNLLLINNHIKYFINKKYFHINNEEFILNISRLKHFLKQQCSNIIEGHTCFIIDCPICNNLKTKSKIYVNKNTGFFMCDKCKSMGSWNILEKFLSLKKLNKNLKELDILKTSCSLKENFIETWNYVTCDCQSIQDLSAEEYNILLNNFSLPHVLQKDMSKLNCFYNKKMNIIYFPLIGLNTSIVGYKLLSTKPQKEETVPIFEVSGCIEYRRYHSKNDDTAIIVSTIDDLLAIMLKQSANVIVCLPYNLRSLPQQLLPYMESFKKLILWFDNDEVSWNIARHFAKKLNEKRCYLIRPTDLQPRPKLAAEMNYDFNSILKNAQPLWHKSIITFQDLKEEILIDLQNNDKVQGIKWKRYTTLNRILKGHRRGEFTILTGPTGCGKTTFMSEYSLDLAMQGINTLWGSFEIRNVKLVRTMLQQMVGVPLSENLQNFNTYANAFEKLPIYFMTFHGQQNIKVVMDAVEHATYVHDIAHVVIDNVQFMMGMSNDSKYVDRFWKQDNIIAKFRNFATVYNCHVTMIIHPRKERSTEELTTSSIFGSAKASQEADNVLIIQDNRLTSIRGKKYLQVAKNRYSGDLGIMVLDFDKSSLSYTSKLKTKEKKNLKLKNE